MIKYSLYFSLIITIFVLNLKALRIIVRISTVKDLYKLIHVLFWFEIMKSHTFFSNQTYFLVFIDSLSIHVAKYDCNQTQGIYLDFFWRSGSVTGTCKKNPQDTHKRYQQIQILLANSLTRPQITCFDIEVDIFFYSFPLCDSFKYYIAKKRLRRFCIATVPLSYSNECVLFRLPKTGSGNIKGPLIVKLGQTEAYIS